MAFLIEISGIKISLALKKSEQSHSQLDEVVSDHVGSLAFHGIFCRSGMFHGHEGHELCSRDAGIILRTTTRVLVTIVPVGLGIVLGATAWASLTSPQPPSPDPTVTAGFLEHSQLAHHPLDTELAGKFLDRYLDDLDESRSLLLQSDVAEFAEYRSNLAQAIHRDGDTSAAHAIFARLLQRLSQRTAYVTDLLRTEEFDFSRIPSLPKPLPQAPTAPSRTAAGF